MFTIKKIVSPFFFPLPLTLEFLLVGLFLLWFTRRLRAGKALVTCGVILLLGLSNPFAPDALLRPLEHRYRPLVVAQAGADARVIVILGGGANQDPGVPISSHLSPDQEVRLIEGLRLHREIPGSKLILSGGYDDERGMTEIAEALGARAEDIQWLSEPRDTEEESQQVARIVGSQRLILVTSAWHMPRAMAFFRKAGMQPIAAPTDYLAPRRPLQFDDYIPDGYKLFKSQMAIHEYLGLAWETLRGGI